MTAKQRLDKVELMLAEMQIRIDSISANLEDVTLQLNKVLKRIEFLEERDELKRKNISMLMFKGRLN
jgi:hypothetical protein